MKIKEMLVVRKKTIAEVLGRLNELFKEGWQPYGSFYPNPEPEKKGICHTVVRYDQENI